MSKITIIAIILISQILIMLIAFTINKFKGKKLNSINVVGIELIFLPHVAGIIRPSGFSSSIFLLCLVLAIVGISLLNVNGIKREIRQ